MVIAPPRPAMCNHSSVGALSHLFSFSLILLLAVSVAACDYSKDGEYAEGTPSSNSESGFGPESGNANANANDFDFIGRFGDVNGKDDTGCIQRERLERTTPPGVYPVRNRVIDACVYQWGNAKYVDVLMTHSRSEIPVDGYLGITNRIFINSVIVPFPNSKGCVNNYIYVTQNTSSPSVYLRRSTGIGGFPNPPAGPPNPCGDFPVQTGDVVVVHADNGYGYPEIIDLDFINFTIQ